MNIRIIAFVNCLSFISAYAMLRDWFEDPAKHIEIISIYTVSCSCYWQVLKQVQDDFPDVKAGTSIVFLYANGTQHTIPFTFVAGKASGDALSFSTKSGGKVMGILYDHYDYLKEIKH